MAAAEEMVRKAMETDPNIYIVYPAGRYRRLDLHRQDPPLGYGLLQLDGVDTPADT